MSKKYSYNSFADFGKAYKRGELDKNFSKALSDNKRKQESKKVGNKMSAISQNPNEILKFMGRR